MKAYVLDKIYNTYCAIGRRSET